MNPLFQLLPPDVEARRASLVAAAQKSGAFKDAVPPAAAPGPKFSVMRVLDGMANDDLDRMAPYEATVCRAAAMAQGSHFDPRHVVVPWAALMGTRDLTASGVPPSAGGYLVGSNVATALDVLRPFSVTGRMGLSGVDGLTQNLIYPNVNTPATGSWLANEQSSLSVSDATIGAHSAKPKAGGAVMRASYQFMKQARQSEAFIRTQLLGAAGTLLDQAVLQGSGSQGQPLGLLTAPGVGAQSGAVTHANMLDIVSTLATAKANDENIRFLTTPAVRRILQAREAVSTSGRMIWERDMVADKPGAVSTDVPAATIFAGDWSQCLVAFWGSGMEIAVDPYANFRSGAVDVRILMNVDVVFLKPAAFVRHTSAS